MAKNSRPIELLDYLPAAFRPDAVSDTSFLSEFLKAFEDLFEELESAIEGTPGGDIQLTVQSVSGTTITVKQFDTGTVGFPTGTAVTLANGSSRTTLSGEIQADSQVTELQVSDSEFAAALAPNDILVVHAGGIPDLFNPETSPPPQMQHRPQSDLDYLEYLSSWIGLPIRSEKSVDWNRLFFMTAITLYAIRSTLAGLDGMIRAWLKGDLLESDPASIIITDLTRRHTDTDAIFQLGETATLGVDTVLGEGPPFFFVVDLVAATDVPGLRNPTGLELFQRAACFIINSEKPAYTHYQLRIRTHTMQLAPENDEDSQDNEVYAQIGETAMLWDSTLVYNSDC